MPNVRSATIRKEGRDGGLTPTEKHRKDKLMLQFTRGDGPKGASPEYLERYELIDWTGCAK